MYSSAPNVWFFYIGGILAGASSGLFGTIPMNLLLSNWFYDKRGTMTGIAYTGSSLITSLLSPIVSKLIIEFGWRASYRILAISIIVIVCITILLIRLKPEDIGQKPYGTAGKTEAEIQPTGFMRRDAMKKSWFWLYTVGIFLIGLIVSGTSQQLVTYWTSEGISAEKAAALYSLVMIIGLVAKIMLGNVFDRLGSSKSIIVCGVICAVAFVSLALCLGDISAFVPSVLFGIVTAELVILPTFTTQRIFGRIDYAANVSLFTTILFLGSSFGIPLCAGIFDITGSYRAAWFIYAVIAVILTFLFYLSNKLSIRAFRTELNIERED
ncbi:MFS transporter [Faecalicatena acetigenes]|uniref:MFS transporter n=2 Tax=Lachnospiraceae TaxID=186803 RepID=A0ABT2TBK5_9FIRM|nr:MULTISPECIES: MFS transporter [Lachnospiraceae]MCU6747099.1 MFS transporter [Faecalicatena acetigenes]